MTLNEILGRVKVTTQGLEGEVLRCECALRDRNGEPRPFGIGISSAVSSSANQPKDVLLAAVPVGVAWPESETERGNGGE